MGRQWRPVLFAADLNRAIVDRLGGSETSLTYRLCEPFFGLLVFFARTASTIRKSSVGGHIRATGLVYRITGIRFVGLGTTNTARCSPPKIFSYGVDHGQFG
jgi:hypothetical protein